MLYLLFFASGFAGLVYEVCWVREFGNEFGNTTYSASLVTAVFMCGLGVGSLGAGGWADRRAARATTLRSLLRAYGAAEIGIAAFGIALACTLPRLGGLSALFSSYTRGPEGWFELSAGSNALRYATAIILMAVPTFLMGATLTLLVRYVTGRDPLSASPTDGARGPRWAGWHIGAMYGVNTAGAAVGALLTDALLVPRVGILRTQLVAAAVNVVVAVGALFLAHRLGQADHTDVAPEPETADSAIEPPASDLADRERKRPVIAACIALGLSGFAALGMEIVWFRFLSASLGAYRPVFSLLLTIILAGICLGALAGGYCHRRFGRALELFLGAQALFGVSSLALMATFTKASGAPYGGAFMSILAVVGLPALLMGFSFPLVNAHVQDAVTSVGRRIGLLYLANTFGSVAGSLVAGFVLTPRLGGQTTVLVFAACAMVAPLPLVAVAVARQRGRALWVPALLSAAVSIPALGAWGALPPGHLLGRFLPVPPTAHRVLDTREGTNEIVSIVEVEGGYRFLVTNGHPMSGTTIASQRYMRAFAHIPLLMSDHPEHALVICFGVGNTLRAVSLHPSLERIEVADLSRNVLSHAGFFAATNQGVLADPRVSVFVEDGRQHLRQQPPDSYDLVTLEPPPIVFAGVASLYSREFYELVRSRLAPNGFMTQWLPAYQVPPETALAMVRAFVDVFPVSALLSGEGSELILIGTRRDTLRFDLDQLDAGLRANPAVQASLREAQMGSLTELVGTFVADADALRRATAGVRPVTDDWPIMEYTFGRDLEVPRELFATGGLRRFCPKCFDGDRPDPRVALLPRYMEALDRLYASREFRRNIDPIVADVSGDVADTISRSEYLRASFGAPRTGWSVPELRAQAARSDADPKVLFTLGYALGRSGNLVEAARAYERGLALAPDDVEARYNLAVVYASSGREEDAVAEGQKVLAAEPSHVRARAMLCSLRGIACGP